MLASVHFSGEPRRLELSIVVAFFAQARELSLVLASFLEQELEHEAYEIIVVDDHSPDHQGREVVRRSRADWPSAQIRYVRHWRGDGGAYGASAKAKNIGIRLARGELVLFNNAEIAQAGQSLTHILETMKGASGPICLRGVVLDMAYERIVGLTPSGREALHDSTSRACERVASADHAGLAAISRELLVRVGGNDERFDYWGKEDLDLAARLKRAGVGYRYDQRLKSFHISHPKNHVKAGDYRRMESLLAENDSTSKMEANVGRAWGELGRPSPEQLDVTLVVELSEACFRAGGSEAVERLVYGEGAERWEVVVVCEESERRAVESRVQAKWPQLPIVSYDAQAAGTIMARVMRQSYARNVAWAPPGFELASAIAAIAGAGRGRAVAWLSSGETGDVGWVVDRLLLPWDSEWGAPHGWAERALVQFVPPEAWHSRVTLLERQAADAESDALTLGSPLAVSGSVLAVLAAASDVHATTRALRSLLSQERAPDATCILIPDGFPRHDGLASELPNVSLYAVTSGAVPLRAVQAAAGLCRFDALLWTPDAGVSTRDRVKTLVEQAAAQRVAVLRERALLVSSGGHGSARFSDEARRSTEDSSLRERSCAAVTRRSCDGCLLRPRRRGR